MREPFTEVQLNEYELVPAPDRIPVPKRDAEEKTSVIAEFHARAEPARLDSADPKYKRKAKREER